MTIFRVRLIPISNPPNRFLKSEIEYSEGAAPPTIDYEVFEDSTREIIATNDSPDVGFRYSVNPYRGCQHACAYCFARPTHEYLGLHAGTDFDRKIVIKPRAPELLRQAFDRKSWAGDTLVFSGVTDCYQPLEAAYRLTRGCLEVCLEYRNPVGIITKSALVERDLDLLVALTKEADASVAISIPFWDAQRARAIEPYAPAPARRMKAVERLAKAGVRVGVMMGPLIPGLCEDEIARVLAAAKGAGARFASYVLLRLNGSVRPVFEERIRQVMPLRAERILERTREVHGGHVSDSRFGVRQRGEGQYAGVLEKLFSSHARRLGFATRDWETRNPDAKTFRRPLRAGDQLSLGEIKDPQ